MPIGNIRPCVAARIILMELENLKGVGPVALERLKDAGVKSIDDLAKASLEDLESAGMSDRKGQKLIDRAKEKGVLIKSATDVAAEIEDREKITTGMPYLDEILDGGWTKEQIIGVAGETGAGKTQVAFYSLVKAAEQTGLPVIYIETEPGRFSPKRLLQFAESKDTLDLIHCLQAHDLEEQKLAYRKAMNHYDEVGLVAVDSFTANFRLSDEFEGRGSFSSRSDVMAQHLTLLREMATSLNAPALLTGQVYGNPTAYGAANNTYGGSLFGHTVNYFLYLSDGQGSLSKGKVMNNPEVKDTEFHINITDTELEGMKDS